MMVGRQNLNFFLKKENQLKNECTIMSEPKNLVKEGLFSKGELWLNNRAYILIHTISQRMELTIL